MTDREILSNAIDKAIANGWIEVYQKSFLEKVFNRIPNDYPKEMQENAISNNNCIKGIIFSHSFAKAFFSEELYRDIDLVSLSDIRNSNAYIDKGQDTVVLDDNFTYRELPAWKFHLQQMVLEENPIKYLERFL